MGTKTKAAFFIAVLVNVWAAWDHYARGQIGMVLAILWSAGAIVGFAVVMTLDEMGKKGDAEEEREARFAHERELKRMELEKQTLVELRKTEAERVPKSETQHP